MADETQVPPHRAGAAETAPTSPHATPRADGKTRTGPERFWSKRRLRVAFTASFALSLFLHLGASPWRLLPNASLEIKDAVGDLAIPIDLLSEEEPAPAVVAPPPEPPPHAPDPAHDPKGAGPDAGVKPRDAAADRHAPDAADADVADARLKKDASDAGDGIDEDAGLLAAADADVTDGGGAVAALSDAGDGGALATTEDAGGRGPGGGDPASMMGAAGQVKSGKQNVYLILNMAEVRKNPVGAALGPLITAIPQWNDFLAGSKVDPVQHTEWLTLHGPSLAHTERDAVIVRYTLDDVWVDAAIDRIAKRSPDGRKVDVGVPGVKTTLGFGDRAKRAFVRPQPHLVIVVPPDSAAEFAKAFKSYGSPKLPPGQAVYFKAWQPHGSITEVPEEISELRIRVMRAENDGVDIFGEGDCADAAGATKAAAELRDLLRRTNALGVKLVTRGVLNKAEVHADGSQVKLHVPVSREQLDALYALAAGFLGVNVPPPGAASGGSAPAAPPAFPQ